MPNYTRAGDMYFNGHLPPIPPPINCSSVRVETITAVWLKTQIFRGAMLRELIHCSRRFERSLMTSLTGSNSPRGLIDYVGECSTITRNVGTCLPKDTAWHCIRLELSAVIIFVNLINPLINSGTQPARCATYCNILKLPTFSTRSNHMSGCTLAING
jgi:hypothetical protein